MTNQRSSLFLITLSNFIAAFGGGTILGKGMGILKYEPLLRGDSLLALLLAGSLVVVINRQISGHRIAQNFGTIAAVLSTILCLIVHSAHSGFLTGVAAWVFFGVLCLRFAAYFVARTQRAEKASIMHASISWVEMSFYAGTVAGLLVWTGGSVDISLEVALIIDVALQAIAGAMDFWVQVPAIERSPTIGATPVAFSRKTVTYLISAIIIMVVGNQIAQFAFAHLIREAGGTTEHLAARIVAMCYLGGTAGAFFAASWRIRWEASESTRGMGNLVFARGRGAKEFGVPFAVVIGISTLLLVGGIVAFKDLSSGYLAMFGVFSTTFFLEINLLAILERLAEWGRLTGNRSLVANALGMMGFGGGVGLLLILNFADSFQAIVVWVIAFHVLAILCLRNRNAHKQPSVGKIS